MWIWTYNKHNSLTPRYRITQDCVKMNQSTEDMLYRFDEWMSHNKRP